MTPKPIAAAAVVTTAFLNDLSGVIDRSTSTVDVVSTAALTSIYTKSIAAGSMSTDRGLELWIGGDWLNNTGSNQGLRFQVIFGATTMFDITNASLGASNAARQPILIHLMLQNLGAANSQLLTGRIVIPDTSFGAATTGIGNLLTTSGSGQGTFGGTAAENTALATTLDIKVAPSAASASLSIRKKGAILQLL